MLVLTRRPNQSIMIGGEIVITVLEVRGDQVRIGIKAKEVPVANRPASNLVFLLDTSGSMDAENKLQLLKRAFKLLIQQLDGRACKPCCCSLVSLGPLLRGVDRPLSLRRRRSTAGSSTNYRG